MENQVVEYIVIGVYLAVILAVGPACRKLTTDTSDFFKGGSRGTWWIVGMSSFMSGISALTFTGNGGAAFMAGWSVLAIYLGGIAAYLVHVLYLGRMFRQLRVTTFPEALRARFGPVTQQVFATIGILIGTLIAGLWLLGLSIFAATCFSLPLEMTIPALGLTVLFYSTIGGRWAVLSADFIQGMVMFVMTILLTILCFIHFDGIGGFFAAIKAQDLTDTFQFIKPTVEGASSDYTLEWFFAIFAIQFIGMTSMVQSTRYFSVKDGKSATKAAMLTGILMIVGTLLWFIPPMTARLLFADEVLASGMPKPEEAAFAIIAMKLLPTGLIGMMVVAMFAATMSSVDTGLNGNVAILIRDIVPSCFRRLGRPLPPENVLLRWSRIMSVVFGLMIIGIAYYLAVVSEAGIFSFAIGISATMGMPMAIPLVLCLFIRRAPSWACLFSFGVGLIPSVIYYLNPGLMSFGERTFGVIFAASGAFYFSMLFPQTVAYRKRVDEFFETMHRPVDFEKEVGKANDNLQLLIMSRFALVIGVLIALLLFIPNPMAGRLSILAVSLVILTMGLGFHLRVKATR
ncbi:sodium:solute symporter family transporter [Coraliomargarita sp. W4R72]